MSPGAGLGWHRRLWCFVAAAEPESALYAVYRYVLPLAELGGDFYDELKSVSSGYASFDYEEGEYRWGGAWGRGRGEPLMLVREVAGC